jgi:hypothetical protein
MSRSVIESLLLNLTVAAQIRPLDLGESADRLSGSHLAPRDLDAFAERLSEPGAGPTVGRTREALR